LSRADAVTVSPWAERSRTAGFGPDEARRAVDRAIRRATEGVGANVGSEADAARLVRDVTVWLAARRSTFGLVDVLQALSAVHAPGTTAAEAHRWARSFHDASPHADDGRRTSALAVAEDSALLRAALARARGSAASSPGGGRPRVEPGVGRRAAPSLGGGGGAVEIMASPTPTAAAADTWPVARTKGGFVSQAETLDAARTTWQRAGQSVAVMTVSDVAARRWRALTGLDRYEAGELLPTVLIVDRADRRPTRELRRILDEAARNATTVVLVEGGTLPPRRAPLSQGLGWLAAELGRVTPAVRRSAAAGRLTTGRLEVCQRGHDAIDQVLDHWSRWRTQGGAARMVALGPAECDELNHRARAVLRATGAITGEEVVIGGRPFAVGDEVVATRRAPLPAGTIGHVTGVDRRGSMTVQCSEGPVPVDAWAGRRLRHAYATTPGMLHFDDCPLVVLGEPTDLGHHAHRVVAAALVAGTGRLPDLESTPGWTDDRRLAPGARPVEPLPAHLELTELQERRRSIARALDASRPVEPGGDRRRLEEDRAWRHSRGHDLLADPDWQRREAGVQAAEEAVARWEGAYRAERAEWVAAGEAIRVRVDALTRAAEADPFGVPLHLGRPPSDAVGREAWRQAVRRALLAGERPVPHRSPTERVLPTERALPTDRPVLTGRRPTGHRHQPDRGLGL
jgi:hypothetical protein